MENFKEDVVSILKDDFKAAAIYEKNDNDNLGTIIRIADWFGIRILCVQLFRLMLSDQKRYNRPWEHWPGFMFIT